MSTPMYIPGQGQTVGKTLQTFSVFQTDGSVTSKVGEWMDNFPAHNFYLKDLGACFEILAVMKPGLVGHENVPDEIVPDGYEKI